jgi:signal transduction histidine kinase
MGLLNLKRLSLKMRFVYAFVFVIIITITILSLTNYFRWKHNYLRQARDEGLILTQTLAQGSIDPIIRNDFYTLEEYVNNLIKKKNIAYVVIMDRHDRALAHNSGATGTIPREINKRVRGDITPYLVQTYYNAVLKIDVNDISVPVLIDSKKWGTVRVGFSLEYIKEEIAKNVFVVIVTGLISMLLGIAMALILTRFVTGPIEKFAKSMKTVAAGDLEQEIRMDTTDEFGVLAMSFNQMARSLRESKEELKKTYQRLVHKEKMAALGELTARIAHEIKNPLGIIKGSAQILVEEAEEPEIKTEVAGYIIEEVNRLNIKIHDLLNHAKPKPPNLKEVDLNEILESRIKFWESQRPEERNVTIIRKLNREIPFLQLDKEQIRQLVLNMIINACEAMPNGGELRIMTDWNSEGDRHDFEEEKGRGESSRPQNNGYVRVEFKDTGIGIPKKDIQKIFDPFFTTKENGTGLGLSTVYRIIENHRGKIEVESREGEGSRFSIFFSVNGVTG